MILSPSSTVGSWLRIRHTLLRSTIRGYREHRTSYRVGSKKIWRKAAAFFPPNWDHHHLFLPPLKQVLEEREAFQYPVRVNDIGFSHDKWIAVVSGKELEDKKPQTREERKRAAAERKAQEEKIVSSDSLIQSIPTEIEVKKLDYENLHLGWIKSLEGKEQIQNLAHHYHIYRDLFSSPPCLTDPKDKDLPKVKVPLFTELPDHIMTATLFNRWFPGSVRLKDPPPQDVYHFLPHVSIHVEFAVEEELIAKYEDRKPEGDPNDLVISPVFRGNLLYPLYASSRPFVTIDARINGASFPAEQAISSPTGVSLLTEPPAPKSFYSVLLMCLDSPLGDDYPVCHWAISNVSKNNPGQEVMPYLHVYGIEGFGYHRYAFLVLQHEKELSIKPIEEFLLKERQLNLRQLITDNGATPLGLSWFQTTYDDYSKYVMHHVLNMRCPVYEYIEEPAPVFMQTKHPFAAPFNLYLDHFRDPKEIAAGVLKERLKKVDPLNYDKEFERDPLPNAYLPEIRDIQPSWMQSTEWKRRNRLGDFRGLRPHSAKIPHDNNADLDKPFWPPPAVLDLPNPYPDILKRPVSLRETKWSLPPHEHPQYYIQHEDYDMVEEKGRVSTKPSSEFDRPGRPIRGDQLETKFQKNMFFPFTDFR